MVAPPIPNQYVSTFAIGQGLCAVAAVPVNGHEWWLESKLPCHGVLNRTGNIRAFATSLREGEDASYHQAAPFWRWLFRGDDSPYRPMSLAGDFLYHDGRICGYVWYEMGDWSKNYFMHLLMASRIPQEFYGRLRAWEKLQAEHGMSALQAFYLIHYVSYIEDGDSSHWALVRGESLHSPFHADYTASFKALKKCKPNDKDTPLARTTGYYSAVNKLFVPALREDRVRPMIKKLFEPKADENKPEYRGPFKKAWEYRSAIKNTGKTVKELNLDAWDWEVVYEH